jgi:hypothetical protein
MNLKKQNKQVFYSIFFSLSLLTFSAEAQQEYRKTFMGRIINSNTKAFVNSALIFNATEKKSTMSDSLGLFSIPISMGDTLRISRLGFFPSEIIIKGTILIENKIHSIELSERSYELNNVTVLDLGTYDQFKYKVISTKTPESNYTLNPSIAKALNKKITVLQPQASVSLGSPVTAMYNLLSKEGRSKRHLEKAIEKDKIVESYKHKYSPEIVSNLTGYKDLELEKFMKYCNLSNEFILKATEYDIAERIVKCLEQYKTSQELTKTDTIP